MKNIITHEQVRITGGFWKQKQDMNREVTVPAVYDRFFETGRFSAFKLSWKEGDPNMPHFFWDSDVAKWIESAAYLLEKEKNEHLEQIIDEVVEDIAKGRTEDGYFNSYFLTFTEKTRFSVRDCHELYCLGHLIEAAIAYDRATGKRKFLELMCDYVDLVERLFVKEKSTAFDSPGHQEIELALVRLYDHTGEKKYLDLASFFVERRGDQNGWGHEDKRGHYNTYHQDHLPVREQTEAVGHSVRAMYLYCAMADLALRTQDAGLSQAAKTLFDNVYNSKMYLTGAVGSEKHIEGFGEAYRLPSDIAYAETCATLSFALFASRMRYLEHDAKYSDLIERVIYNGFLSGLSMDGKSFFYANAQEVDLRARRYAKGANRKLAFPPLNRVEVFSCSCCPPNITRFIAAMGDYVYHAEDNTVYVDQYMESEASFDGITLKQKTAYPFDGAINLTLEGGDRTLALRIPAWCDSYLLCQNGETLADAPTQQGYRFVEAKNGDVITLTLALTPRMLRADPRVRDNRGKAAWTYGPFVMCMEGVDNGEDLGEVSYCGGEATVGYDDTLNLPTLTVPALREQTDSLFATDVSTTPFQAKLIPYFAFANRGECDMFIWMPLRS